MHRPKFPELFENPKILIPDIVGAGGLSATIDKAHVYTNHSFNCCVPKHYLVKASRNLHFSAEEATLSRQYDIRTLLAVINSRLMMCVFVASLGGKMHASPANVRRLPIPRIDFKDPESLRAHNELAALADAMLSAQQEWGKAERGREDRRHELKRRIEELDREIDRLVYKLYDLTEDEIRLIEAG